MSLPQSIIDAMSGHQAHITLDDALQDFPPELRGTKPAGATHSAWQLLAHMRITQTDILDYSRGENYQSLQWPDDYWPKDPKPPTPAAWDDTIDQFKKEQRAMAKLLADHADNLLAPVPHGEKGHTYLREALLLANHNSYHLGQFVTLKMQLLATAR